MLTPFSEVWAGPEAPLYISQAPILAALALVALVANYSAVNRLVSIVQLVREREVNSLRPLYFKEDAAIEPLVVDHIIDPSSALPSTEVRG
jgi:hypothetical protein